MSSLGCINSQLRKPRESICSPLSNLARIQHENFPHDDIADFIFHIGVCYLLGLLVYSGVAKKRPCPRYWLVDGSCQEFGPLFPPWLLFEFRRVLHLDCPWSPVREGMMDLFPWATLFLHLEYRLILFWFPWDAFSLRPQCLLVAPRNVP
jgi:hypothetical protein